MRSSWRTETLANDELRVVVLPDKGADIVDLEHRASAVSPLFQAPWGLQPPGSKPREGSNGLEFLENYEGGWQELFPSVNDPCRYRGQVIPFHGEVATLRWKVERRGEALRCSVRCPRTPFHLERVMRLERASLLLEETVTNEGDEPAHFVWGHHCVLGPPFLEAGCRFETSARTIETIPELWEETARLEPGQRSPWPRARLRSGGAVDLREVPGREAGSHDDVYLTDLGGRGWARVRNPSLGLAFTLEWDATVFRWLISWQAYGGAQAMPLAGSYALGVEPWTTRLNLEQAVAAGQACELAAGGSFATVLTATLDEWRP